jgi:hypothetical protein
MSTLSLPAIIGLTPLQHYLSSSHGWTPAIPQATDLSRPVVSLRLTGNGGVDLAGIGTEGQLYFSELQCERGSIIKASTRAYNGDKPVRAAAILGGRVAAVTEENIVWLRMGPDGLHIDRTLKVNLGGVLACFPHYRGDEMILICADGTIVRVPSG